MTGVQLKNAGNNFDDTAIHQQDDCKWILRSLTAYIPQCWVNCFTHPSARTKMTQGWNCRGGGSTPSSCLQTLIFEWKWALNFNPWAKFQTFRLLTPLPVLLGQFQHWNDLIWRSLWYRTSTASWDIFDTAAEWGGKGRTPVYSKSRNLSFCVAVIWQKWHWNDIN